MAKLRVGILFGGRSTEHEVSVMSAMTVLRGLDPARYTPVLIGIDHDGRWYAAEPDAELLPEEVFGHPNSVEVTPSLGAGLGFARAVDILFLVTHGRFGEDGTLQGLLDFAGVPYIGAGVLGSAVAMDKVMTKRVLRDAGLPVVPCLETNRHDAERDPEAFLDEVEDAFSYPVMVKPVNTGSSVGVSKASSREELARALKDAGRYDLRMLVEPCLNVRELETAVLGGWEPEASVVGEVVSANEFYDYEAKYVSEETELILPARIPEELSDRIRSIAVQAFRVTDCWGMARVDFFFDRDSEQVMLNELNTLPGMTPDGSLYWKAWEATGIALPDLLSRLIELGLERHRERASLEIRFRS